MAGWPGARAARSVDAPHFAIRLTVVEWTNPPLVPVIVIVKVRFCVLRDVTTVNVDWALVGGPRVTPVGLKLVVIALPPGETLAVRLTKPVNPLTAVTVTT